MAPKQQPSTGLEYFQKTAWRLWRSLAWIVLELVHAVTLAILTWFYQGKSHKIPMASDPLLLQPAVAIAAKIRLKKVTSEEVVSVYIRRIQQVNPILNAVVDERFQDALAEARAIDVQIAAGHMTSQQMELEKPFWGVPMTVKDSCAVKGLRQTVGLIARKDAVADKDAEVVKLMRDAGAIVVGVTNLPELSSSFDTCNKVYGQTRNPYDTTRSPGGSSGGEGSILASAGSVIGIGTDFAGSIRIPAMLNGVFGHKPTSLSLSAEGTVPVLSGEILKFFTTGPLTRYAVDLRPMMRVMTNSDVIRQRLDQPVDIKRLRVYYVNDEPITLGTRPVHSDIWRAQDKVINYMKNTHGIEVQRFNLPEISEAIKMALALLRHYREYPFLFETTDRKVNLNLWVELLKTLAFSSNHTFCMMTYCLVERVQDQSLLRLYSKMDALRKRLEAKFDELFAGDNVVLIMPTFPTCAFYYNMTLMYQLSFAYSSLVNILGLPASQFPVCLNQEGLPVGLQVLAGKNNDHLCLAFAEEMERGFGGWMDPALRTC